MEAAIRSHQVGTSQQSAQQPQSDLSGVRGTTSAGPPQHTSHSMSQYSQPRNNASGGINEVHRSSATNSAYQIQHTIPHSYVNVDQRNRVRGATNTFPGASANSGKTNYNWQPQNPQFEYATRTTLHQPTMGTVPTNFVSANFPQHGGFPPRVSIPQQPQNQPPVPISQSQSVSNSTRPLTVNDYINANIRDGAAAHLQASQPNQRPQPPDPGGQQNLPPQQQQAPSSQPAHKKIRLGESPYQPQTNSLHHPAATPSSIPVRLHHTNYEKAGPPIQSSNSHVVVHVASTPRTHQNPIVGATADIQYQPQKPPSQPPTHQIPTAASPQAPQTQPQQQQQQTQSQQQQQQQQQPPSNTNTKVLSVLKIDTRDPPPPNSNSNNNNTNNSNLGGGYHPKTEAISPAGSPKLSKDDLLQQISSVDSSMMSLEERKKLLKEKERMLIEQKEEGVEDVPEQPTPHRTLAQQIYAENKKKASDSHAILTAFNFKGQTFELPLYNQPSDADVCRKIHEQYLTFRSSLLLHLRKIKSERAQRSQELSDQYAKLSAEWQKRVEKIESSMKRKNRELKNRELFEKVFVELRKQREDKERFNRVGSRVKSEADFEVIVDGLQEQAQEDKKMRSYAVIPPLMFDSRQRRLVFQNENGSQVDMEAELSAYKTLNLWTSGEKEIFRDKYVQHSKNFGYIASNLERKNAQDCVRYYYLSKKDIKYKQLLRKSSKRTRSTKNLPKTSESQSLLDLMTTGVTTRLQRKSRNTSRSSNATSATASAAESQTTNSNSTSTRSSAAASSSAPLPTVTVTVNSSSTQSQENVKEEIDPLCIRSMSETASPSPVSNSNKSTTRRASSNGNLQSQPQPQTVETSSSTSTSTTNTTTSSISSSSSSSFLPAKIKTEPDGDVVMKTESDNNNWSTYPPNGLKHEVIKAEEIKTEGKAVDDIVKKEATNVKEEKKIEIKKEPNDDKENDEGKGKKTISMDVDEENWNSCEPSAKKPKIEESGANDLDKALYPCIVCKQENCSRTRPLEKAKAQQFGLTEENIPTGARICSNCQSKAVKSRFPITSCPLPTCPNPKDRVTRLRNLPSRLSELSPEERDPIIKELQIPPKVTKCCSVCLTRIKRKMGTQLLGTTSLTDDEIQQFRKQLQDVGPKWNQLAEQLNKSATVLKTFYFHYKKKYGFDQAVNEYYKLHVNEDRRAITDGDESDISVTSSDDNGSDTHKNDFTVTESEKADNTNGTNSVVKNEPQIPSTIPSIPVMPIPASKENTVKNEPPQQQLQQPPTTIAQPQQIIDDRLPPPLGQPPPLLSSQQIQNLSTMPRAPDHPMIHIMRTKKHSEEYDSSATETADEENESSPANRQSPKTSSVFAGKSLNPATTISMVPSAQQNGPSNVRDVMHNVIERSLKNTQVPPLKPNPPGPIDNSPDVSFVSSYRQDPKQMQQSRRSNSDGLQTLATLSIVNSHGPPPSGPQNPQIIAGHPLNISSIAATITPVPPPSQGNQPPRSSSTPQHLNAIQEKDLKYGRPHQPPVNQQPEPEPQTLDLSIKKPQQQQQQPPERNFPAFQAKAPPPPTGGSIYRGDPSANIPNQAPYLAFHPDMNRPSKSPSTYIGPSLSPGQQRVMSLGPHGMQQPQQIVTNKSKVTQKLSPKVHHHQVQQQQGGGQVQQMNGPKGSITLGTPLNDRGQPIMIQNSPQGPRYDILRQTPPNSDNKFGSITAGTPIHLSDKRVHEYIKGNNRHSPATNQPPNVSSAQTPTITSYRQPGELSSTRDLVFSDYMISQQMQGHNQQSRGGPPNMPNTINIISGGPGGGPGGRPEKESPSPRSLAHSNSPASLYYADKERERAGSGQTRTEYLSRSSPADHHNSTPSPHRTPPPQRQGVIIQRHNAGGSKPPSPAPQRLQVNQGHYTHHYSQGHDALSNLVDVAVAQQALPVPNDGSRRHMPPITSESQSIQRERYPYLIPSDVNVMLQQQQNQIEMIRRHELERKEMEKREMIAQERERDRERDERDAQRRHEAELAQRNFERDRMEQLRIPYTSRALSYGRGPDEVISAQHLINAIITENISRPQESRDRYQINPISRLQQAENNGNSHSPNIINVDVDSSSDLSRHQSSISNLPSKNLKLNDITDAIISKDPAFGMHHQQQPGGYHLTSPHFVRTGFSNANTIPSKTPPTQSMAQLQNSGPQLMGQEQIIATDQWKMNRRLQQQQQQKEEMAKSGQNPQGRTTPDDRHIIRMAQTPSPRNKMAYEPVSPPETSAHYHMQPKITINAYDQRNMAMPGQDNAPGDANKLLNMLNNRIAEAMRNDDKYPNEHHRNAERKDSRDSDVMKQYDRPRSGNSIPGNGVDSGEKSPAGKRESPQVYISRPSSQPGQQPFQPAMFMYPYSALNIPQVAAGANPIISPKAASELMDTNRQQSAPPTQHLESRQVLSEQYDALSDED